jgi:hypothetical protein
MDALQRANVDLSLFASPDAIVAFAASVLQVRGAELRQSLEATLTPCVVGRVCRVRRVRVVVTTPIGTQAVPPIGPHDHEAFGSSAASTPATGASRGGRHLPHALRPQQVVSHVREHQYDHTHPHSNAHAVHIFSRLPSTTRHDTAHTAHTHTHAQTNGYTPFPRI